MNGIRKGDRSPPEPVHGVNVVPQRALVALRGGRAVDWLAPARRSLAEIAGVQSGSLLRANEPLSGLVRGLSALGGMADAHERPRSSRPFPHVRVAAPLAMTAPRVATGWTLRQRTVSLHCLDVVDLRGIHAGPGRGLALLPRRKESA